ncbi:hypothetical protein [Granulosicoccus antarcticus]|nr:hypothetical protein [Granulosicoccus antarcticus]
MPNDKKPLVFMENAAWLHPEEFKDLDPQATLSFMRTLSIVLNPSIASAQEMVIAMGTSLLLA